MILPPVFISGPPRAGTTMLAGLLYHHGYWIGRARPTMYPGSNPKFGAENLDIKSLMKKEGAKVGFKMWKVVPFPRGFHVERGEKIKEEIRNIVSSDGAPWLLDTTWTLVFFDFWADFFPEAKWILPARPFEMVLDSVNRHPGFGRKSNRIKEPFIRECQARQALVAEFLGEDRYIWIDVEQISLKTVSEIEKLFNFLEVEVNWKEVNRWIRPGRLKTK